MVDYDSPLANRAVSRILGDFTTRKHPVTTDILQVVSHMDPSKNLHVCMAAPFLVAFFSFLRISKLAPRTLNEISHNKPIFLQYCSIQFHPCGTVVSVTSTTILQLKQRMLKIPLPLTPECPLCPVSALRNYLSRVPAESHFPLFGLYVNDQYQPILAHQYTTLIKKAVSVVGLDPRNYSSHKNLVYQQS